MQWLEKLINRVFKFIPRLKMIAPDEGGVRITLGSHVTTLKPGWFIYWPLIQTIPVIAIMPQVVDLREQGLTTLDGVGLAISGAVEYAVRDTRRAILEVQDYDRSLPTLCLGKIAEYVENHDQKNCTSEKIGTEVRREIREHANSWGISIKHVYITDRIVATAYKIMLNGTLAPITLL